MASGPTRVLRGVSVLIVEDDEDTQLMLRTILETEGAAVSTAGTAAEGLQSFLGLQPDVVVCDLGLPGADGYALLRQIRGLPGILGGSTAAVALTGYAAELTPKVLHAGFQAHLQKPVVPSDVVKTVAALALQSRH